MKKILIIIFSVGCFIGLLTKSHAADISFEQVKKILTEKKLSNIEELNIFEKEWRENATFLMSKTELIKLMQFCYERLVSNDYGKILAESAKKIKTLTPEENQQLNMIVYTQEILSRGYVLNDEYALKYNAFIVGKDGIMKDTWLRMITSAKDDLAQAEARKLLKKPYDIQKKYLKDILSNQKYKTDLSAYYYIDFLRVNPVCEEMKKDSALVKNVLQLIDAQFVGSISTDLDRSRPDIVLAQLYITLAPLAPGIEWLERILQLPNLSPQAQSIMEMRLNQLKAKSDKENEIGK